jgi:glucose/arabinose dehydrogenase
MIPVAVIVITISRNAPAIIRADVPIGPGTTAALAEPPAQPEPLPGVVSAFPLEPIATGFDAPLDVAAAPGTGDLFVVEKTGRIEVISGGRVLDQPFLDLGAAIDTFAERGLLDLEFHPDYAATGRFFVHYSDRQGDTRIVEYMRSDDPVVAEPLSARTILTVDQPHYYHNGGRIQIGPDGYLWLGLGDGGGNADLFGDGQRPDTLLGSLVRIDVDAAEPYAIPPDNPFVAGGGAPEVWAYGLRNPWRFWIDPVSLTVTITDVGQDLWEEVNVVPVTGAGANFGWPVWEGTDCRGGTACDGTFTAPVLSYPHDRTCAIIGGPVYRGAAIPELWGHFVYADYCAGWIKSVEIAGGTVVETRDLSSGIGQAVTSFGVDADGEILVVAGDGVYRLIADRSD